MGNQFDETTNVGFESFRDELRKVLQTMVRSDEVCVGKVVGEVLESTDNAA